MDKTKRNMEERDMESLEAVADAGDTRLQPILLTSITTIMGVVPLAFASEFWVGLSISIIFGIALQASFFANGRAARRPGLAVNGG